MKPRTELEKFIHYMPHESAMILEVLLDIRDLLKPELTFAMIEEGSKKSFPYIGQMYYRINGQGKVTDKKFRNDEKDIFSTLRGEIFLTKKEAEDYLVTLIKKV